MDDYLWETEDNDIKEENLTKEEIELAKYCSDTELEIKEYLSEINYHLTGE